MKKETLTVIIPSRTQPSQTKFLERAIQSIKTQTVIDNFELTVLVGVDVGKTRRDGVAERLGFKFVESAAASQAAALNAAIRTAGADYIAFLEDDDRWLPRYLEVAMKAIALAPFVSSTQVDHDENDVLLRINDFRTPSGWLMTKAVLQTIGEFNEEYRFHLDNEWLGRLTEAKIPGLHMVESTAPLEMKYMELARPWLASVVTNSGGLARLARHDSPIPLVRRLRHSGSGMAQLAASQSFMEISQREQERLIERFGRIPW